MRIRVTTPLAVAGLCLGLGILAVMAQTAPTVSNDPLVRMPGTQPAQGVNLESPNRCLNCHAGYNPSVEPGFNWQGGMMAQAARDFLYWSCLTVAAQDSKWALNSTNATDICLRCHFPEGWLGGRSSVTNGSLMTGSDWDGVHCDFCHSMYDPLYQDTYDGVRESDDWLGYWDETNASSTPSQPAADSARLADRQAAGNLRLFNGSNAYIGDHPAEAGYTEGTSGQYYVSGDGAKRASFADAAARHQMVYSRYHKSKYMCGTCHDVSNPILANLGQDGTTPLTTEQLPAHAYFHVERTFSEFMLSAYGQPGGSAGRGAFDPATFETSNTGNIINKCQDCHMRDVVGTAANKTGAPVRPDGSVEHPKSGQPLHDLTGGNIWVPTILASTVPGSPNYDAVNDALLNQGPAVLTLDLTQGQGLNPAALLAGAERSRQQLEMAASIEGLTYDAASGALSFRVQNNTGHRLTSGFPEGRRIFVSIKAYAGGSLIYAANPYDTAAGTLKGLPNAASSPPLGQDEFYVDELVYETHPESDLTGESETFHFALATGRYKDNRIPPKGYRIDQAAARMSVPVWHGVSAPDYFTAAEYAGGYDAVSMSIPAGADQVTVELFYQTTSREYIEFLRDEINGYPNGGGTLYEPTLAGSPVAYVAQTDPFFTALKAWGDTIWQIWTHNKDLPGAAPVLMASASFGGGGASCAAPTPTLTAADASHLQVLLTWGNLHAANPAVTGYRVYYEQSDKAQLVATAGLVTQYTDGGLTDGQTYCYKVTSLADGCESGYSNILCATPAPNVNVAAGVTRIDTGYYKTSGKGGSQVTVWVDASSFTLGSTVVLRAWVVDATGAPLPGATVDLRLTGPSQVDLVSGLSTAYGIAEASWKTSAPNKRGQGGTATGLYTATVTGITAGGYTWNGTATSVTFTLQ